jgi:hypothetical protein
LNINWPHSSISVSASLRSRFPSPARAGRSRQSTCRNQVGAAAQIHHRWNRRRRGESASTPAGQPQATPLMPLLQLRPRQLRRTEPTYLNFLWKICCRPIACAKSGSTNPIHPTQSSRFDPASKRRRWGSGSTCPPEPATGALCRRVPPTRRRERASMTDSASCQ